MTTEDIIKLELGTKVHLIKNAEIKTWQTIGFHPKHPEYFYLAGNGSIEKTLCLFLDGGYDFHWETDYEIAKQVMWDQLKERVRSINKIYREGKESLNFEK